MVISLALAIAATVAFVTLAKAVIEGHTERIDEVIALGVHRFDTPAIDRVMVFITWLGAGITLSIVVGVVAIGCFVRKQRMLAYILVAVAAATYGVNVILKVSFARARPTLFEEITQPSDYSFPSGHAMQSIAVYGAVTAVLIALHPRLRWILIPASIVLISAIGLSRVYLGVHWPSDVIAGFAAGAPFVLVAVHLTHVATRRLIP